MSSSPPNPVTTLIASGAYSRIADPMAFVDKMGKAIAQSQMFGCENEAQGNVIAMACIAQRRDPLSIPMDYHLMHGRLTLRADAMLGRLVRAGGGYEIVSASSECAEIRVWLGGRAFRERLTWADAQQEPFVYNGKSAEIMKCLMAGELSKLTLSSNYATPRRRGQHLWARVCSDAVRKVAPHLVTGSYTPEEMTEVTGRAVPGVIDAAPVASVEEADARELREERAAIQEEAIDAEFALSAVGTIAGGVVVAAASDSQPVVVQSVAKPTQPQQPAATQSIAAPATQPTPTTTPTTSRNMAAKIDEAEVAAIKELITQVAQLPGCEGITSAVRDTLTSQNVKLADLSWSSAEALRCKIKDKELHGMAELALNKGA